MYDVIVVGAGVVGCSTARELSRYKLDVLVLEKGHDICSGASKANTGMIHAGYDPTPGTNKAKFNAPGCKMMYEICDELDVAYEKSGCTIFATDESGMNELRKLDGYGKQNGVEVRIVEGDELRQMQPHMGKDVKAVLWVPEGGVTTPFSVTFALAENAHHNGVEFKKEAEVSSIVKKEDGTFEVTASGVTYQAKLVINCAGLHSDKINNMISENHYKIIPRFGAHVILDRKIADRLTTSLMETPHDLPGGGHTKGMAIVPTTGGTMIMGCDATPVEDPDFTATMRPSVDQIIDYFEEAWKYLPFEGDRFPLEHVIGIFGGCRPHPEGDDFIIGEADDVPGFINAGGTESPGFTSAVAIARYVVDIVKEKLSPEANENFDPYRKAKKKFRTMTNEERQAAIAEDPDYAKIVCRCEMVTEAEIRDAIRRPLGARTVSEVKLRTRAGMGRCQGGFCGPRVVEILCEELGLSPLEVTQCGGDSQILACEACSGEGLE